MAQIKINEISQNYTFNIGSSSFATVALPITAMWGPAYVDVAGETDRGAAIDDMMESISWNHFPATQEGLESFVSTYRGPAAIYRLAKDYSYQMAMTLLTAGYDVLVCRVCPGVEAQAKNDDVTLTTGDGGTVALEMKAKYPGSFGNKLKVDLKKVERFVAKEGETLNKPTGNYWNAIVYVVDSNGTQTAVENLVFVFDVENSTDTIPHIDEVESAFISFVSTPASDDFTFDGENGHIYVFDGGSDWSQSDSAADAITSAYRSALERYTSTTVTAGGISLGAGYEDKANEKLPEYPYEVQAIDTTDTVKANTIKYREWLFTAAFQVYSLLEDKLNYNPQRIISPGWDDQDFSYFLDVDGVKRISTISPLHKKIMETAYRSRCATGMIDIPKSCPRSSVYNESTDTANVGYAQMLSRISVVVGTDDVNAVLYNTHSALFAPWGSYTYVGMGKQCVAPPSFLALMIQRAMILNQSLQYEWALPTNRKHNVNIGKMDYKVPNKLLNTWQSLEGVGVNVITDIPELGTGLWGNSTLYEVPPATYQALANLSTRYLVNAVEDVAYKCGISITFQYNNEQAYSMFYAGVTPLLDTMRNVGAIEDYYVKMAADIDSLDRVNANSVIGKIYLQINGVINDIVIDLIALPPGTDLNQYRS